MKTTVVIPNFNGKEYLEGCLCSLEQGTVIPPIIVVDNGSTDGSISLVRSNHPQVTVIEFSENRGFSAAVNAGIRHASTAYIFLLNNDATVEPDTVEVLERAMEREPDAFCMGAKMLQMKTPSQMDSAGDLYCALGWAFARGKDKESSKFTKQTRIFSACAGAAIYRKSLLDEMGLFDEEHFAYLEDVDLGYRANIYGYYSSFVPEAVVYHVGSGASGSRYNEFKIRLSSRNSVYLIYKNMPLLQILLNLPFLVVGFGVKMLFFTIKGFGGVYGKGLLKGFGLCFSKEGREHKVRFELRNWRNYCYIQLQLWINMIRRFGM